LSAVHWAITVESDGERIFKIGQHLTRLWARVGCPISFADSWVQSRFRTLSAFLTQWCRKGKDDDDDDEDND